jgi:predicted dehydrogenase
VTVTAATTPTAPSATIGLVGAGWRAEYFLRIARELPDRFRVSRVLVRSEGSAEAVAERWGVGAGTSLADFLSGDYDFVVVSTPPTEAPGLIEALVAAGIPVLSETPPAPDVASLRSLWATVGGAPVQVAEQYFLQPHHAARLAVARSGLLGEVTSATVSVAHGYHGVSLLRRYLGLGLDEAVVTAHSLPDRVLSANSRAGWHSELVEVESPRTMALLRFGDRTAVFDFTDEQYYSPVRSRHVSLRGTRGQVDDDTVRYLRGPGDVTVAELRREVTGIQSDLQGNALRRVTMGDEVLFENRFAASRLNDDEIAGAETMHRMAGFVATGEEFYGLAEASHDHHLGLLIAESARTGSTLRSERMPWSP